MKRKLFYPTFTLVIVLALVTTAPVAYGGVSAARLEITGTSNASTVANVVSQTPGFELSAGDAPPNRGDITLTTGASAYPLLQASGVIIANPNVLRLGSPSNHNIVEVPGELTDSVPPGFPDGTWLATTNVAGVGGAEVNFNVTLAHFPFANGWIAGHVDNDGTLLASNGDVTVTTTARVGWYTLTIPGINAANDGMLFTVGGSNETSGNTVVTSPFPDETGWEVTVMDQQQDFPAGVDQEWSFVYIPYSSINLIGGRVDDDGSLLNSVGSFTVNNTGAGMYEIAVPGKTDADGILLLTISKYATKGGVWGPDDNLLAYTYDPSANSGNGAFVIESVDLAGATPQNTEFVFAFIEYANPIFSGTASNPYPMNRAIHVDPTVVLGWDAPSDVGSPTYNVYIVENDPNFEGVLPAVIDLIETNYDPPGDLELATPYYWRVDIYDPGEDVTYEGPVWAFAIGGMATDPYPADGAPGVRLNTELGWTGDEYIATSYDVYLSTDPNVPTPSSFLGNVTETTYVDPPTGDELTTYYWRVDERDDQGVIAPGEIWSFATGGLLAHWAFDDGSGSIATDSSGNGFNGDISGAAWTAGVLGGALAFDGIDDYVDFGALSEFEIANGTITGWFYVNSWPVQGGIISKDGAGYLDDFELMRDRAGSNKLHFEMHPIEAPAVTGVKSDDDIALASWTHFAISWGGEGMNMWIDGVQQTDTNPWTGGIVSSGFPLVIGTGQYGSVEGLVDEFRLFSGILNDSEIQAIFADSDIAKSPYPYNGEVDVPVEAELIWTAGKNAVTHEVYLRTDPNFAGTVPVATGLTSPSYDPPGDLELSTTYYWCVDEVDSSANVTPGNIWSFTTVPPKAYNPAPTNSATEVDPGTVLSWTPGAGGTYQHDVYIGTDQTIVANATPADSEFKGTQPYEDTDYDPDLNYGITYYWRIDEVDNGDTYKGDLWTFTTIVPVCDPPLPQDITGDCVVNLEDVASMAGAWLQCNWIPEDACP